MSEEQVAPVEVNSDLPVASTPTISEVNSDLPVESAPTEEKSTETVDSTDSQEKSKQTRRENQIARLNRKNGELKAKADMLQRQLEEAKPKPETPKSGLKLADFDYDEDKFAEAVAKEAEQTAVKRYNEEQQAHTQKQAQEQLAKSWESKTSKADSKYDDFDEIVGELKPVNLLNIAIMQAENGDDIAYYLGKNLDEARRIANLDPVAAIREIGRLEAKLLSEPPKAKESSKAPAPITPVKSGSSANKTIFDDGLSQEEFEKMRREQRKRR